MRSSIVRLPIAQYPSIAPPTITINATYPGASAKTLEDTVTQIIEQRMTGLDGLRYIASTSDGAGSATITLTFDAAVNPDIAQVQVQNKLKLAESQLPQEVQQQGVTVTKSVRNFIMVVGFVSEDGSMNRTDIADYVAANVLDPVSRVPGVGELTLFGSQYAMRIWLDPNKLINYKLTPGDVAAAIRAQNAQIAAGQLGGLPAIPGQRLNATISAQGRLQTPAQFEAIVLRTGRRARRFACATSHASNSAAKITTPFRSTTAIRLPVWPCVSPLVRMRCRRPMQSRPRSRNSSASSRPASSRWSPTTRPRSSACRSRKWSRH